MISNCAQNGDLIAFSGDSLVSDWVNVCTYGLPRWGISHVGLFCGGLLFESTTLDGLPCAVTGKRLDGVQAHRFNDVIEAYKGKIWRYPLYRPLWDHEVSRLSRFLRGKLGTPYDLPGAMRSVGVGLSWAEHLIRHEDLRTIFCSELVAKAYSEIGILPTDSASRWSPNKLVRHMRRHEILLPPKRVK